MEQRVIGQKIGARPPAAAPPATPEPAPAPSAGAGGPAKRRPRMRLLIVVLGVVVVAGLAVAAYLLLLKPGPAEATPGEPAPTPTPVPGAVLTVDPVSVNLADGHYLRLGLALQLTADTAEEPDPARALDLAIAWYSGRPIAEVTDPATRDTLKAGLRDQIEAAYEGEVMDLYLTDYVTQ